LTAVDVAVMLTDGTLRCASSRAFAVGYTKIVLVLVVL
jgi:hypothetical protein